MPLKLFTTLCLVAGMLMFLPYALLLKSPPGPDTPKAVRRGYAEELFLFNGVQLLCLVGAGVGAVLIVRKARAEYQEEAVRNMRSLIEASRKDPPNDP